MTAFSAGSARPPDHERDRLIQEGQAGDDPERIREGMSGNLCRCGAYAGITDAVLDAQKSLTEANERRSA